MVEHLHEILYKARERWGLKSRDRIEIGSPFDLLVFRKPETVRVRRQESRKQVPGADRVDSFSSGRKYVVCVTLAP